MFSSNAIAYAWRQLLGRAAVPEANTRTEVVEALGVPFYYRAPETVRASKRCVIVAPCRENAWNELLHRNSPLSWVNSRSAFPDGVTPPFPGEIPVLFWGAGYEDGAKPFVEQRSDGAIIFYADIIAATLFMLTRWEETVAKDRDVHGRFPASASTALKLAFLDRPVVDEYALILQAWILALCPAWQPRMRSFEIKLTHDIDSAFEFLTARQAFRKVAGRLFRRDLASAFATSRRFCTQDLRTDPVYRAITDLAALSEDLGLRGGFYFMAAKPGKFDTGYNLRDPLLLRCIQELLNSNHEVGFHPSYYTFEDPALFSREQAAIAEVLGNGGFGGRQHYLRFKTPDTWRLWDQSGLKFDSTVGYADHEGFRCGTCHPFKPFDLARDTEMALVEIPLLAMDVTLKEYRSLTPEQGMERLALLCQRCKNVRGRFTLLWHNDSLHGEWERWSSMLKSTLSAFR